MHRNKLGNREVLPGNMGMPWESFFFFLNYETCHSSQEYKSAYGNYLLDDPSGLIPVPTASRSSC